MRSYVDIPQSVFVVALDNFESCRVTDGETLTTDHHPLDPEAHISVGPLDTIDPTYIPADTWGDTSFVDNLGRTSLVVVKNTLDTMCYIPREALRDTRIAAERISLLNLIVIADDEVAAQIRDIFPYSGIELRFDGVNRRYNRSVLEYPDR